MKNVMKAYRCRNSQERICVLRLELNYELAVLHEAMVENCTYKIEQCKNRLTEIHKEMMLLEAFR